MEKDLLKKPIKTRADASDFFDYLVQDEKTNFHPDDDFTVYINSTTGQRSFSNEKALQIKARITEAFAHLGNEVYSLAQKAIDKNMAAIKGAEAINMKPKTMFETGGNIDLQDFFAPIKIRKSRDSKHFKKNEPVDKMLENVSGIVQLTPRERELLKEVCKAKNINLVNVNKPHGNEEFDLYFSAKSSGNKSAHAADYEAWLPLAAISEFVDWTAPDIAKKTQYPLMSMAGDWSGVRDTDQTLLMDIFKEFCLGEKMAQGGEITNEMIVENATSAVAECDDFIAHLYAKRDAEIINSRFGKKKPNLEQIHKEIDLFQSMRDKAQAILDKYKVPQKKKGGNLDVHLGMHVQSLVFDKKRFTPETAKQWIHSHGYKWVQPDITKNKIRIRQEEPESFKDHSFRTISFKSGLNAIIAKPKS